MNVERRFLAAVEYRLIRLEQTVDLPLVIGSAPGVQLAIADGGRERRRGPLVERIGRLDVVVAVDQKRGLPRYRRAFGPHHRVSRSLENLDDRAAQTPEVIPQPLRGPPTIRGVSG